MKLGGGRGVESACFISLWPINGDAITVMEMDCCCQQPGLRAGGCSFPREVGARTESERTLLDAPIGSRLGSPEARLEGWGGAQVSALGGNSKGSGSRYTHQIRTHSPKGTGAGRWPGSGLAHTGTP